MSEQRLVVDIVDDGEEGLHLALNDAYDLIILDVLLPKSASWPALSELRAVGLRPRPADRELVRYRGLRNCNRTVIKALD